MLYDVLLYPSDGNPTSPHIVLERGDDGVILGVGSVHVDPTNHTTFLKEAELLPSIENMLGYTATHAYTVYKRLLESDDSTPLFLPWPAAALSEIEKSCEREDGVEQSGPWFASPVGLSTLEDVIEFSRYERKVGREEEYRENRRLLPSEWSFIVGKLEDWYADGVEEDELNVESLDRYIDEAYGSFDYNDLTGAKLEERLTRLRNYVICDNLMKLFEEVQRGEEYDSLIWLLGALRSRIDGSGSLNAEGVTTGELLCNRLEVRVEAIKNESIRHRALGLLTKFRDSMSFV